MRQPFLPEDIRKLTFLSCPVLSEDGRRIACIGQKGEEETGRFPGTLYVFDAQSGRLLLEKGDAWYKQPYFLRDSRFLLYLSDRSGAFQVFLEDLETGSSRQMTTLRHGAERYAVNGQETTLAFEAVLWPEETEAGTWHTEMSPEEKAAWLEELEYRPYKATDLVYKRDEWHGMRKGEYSHIGTVRFREKTLPEALRKTWGAKSLLPEALGKTGDAEYLLAEASLEMECVYPAWSRDGERLAFYAYPDGGAKGRNPALYVCGRDGREAARLTEALFACADHSPVFTADDGAVIGVGIPDFADGSSLKLPFLVPLSGEEKARFLPVGMDREDGEAQVCHGVAPDVAGRTQMGDNGPYFRLSEDGTDLYFLSGFQGRTGLYRARLKEPEKTRQVTLPGAGEDMDILAFSMGPSGIAWLGADCLRPAELFYQGRRLTEANPWLSQRELGRTEEFRVRSRDGKTELQWFLVHPAGAAADVSRPAVLYIKGGPETMYTKTFWHEFQILAGAGFSVIYGNPRGSAGFGRAFNAGGVCWKNEAMEDLLDMVEDAVSRGYAGRGRLGVTGGSYGGYMTNKLLGRTEVFSAAVTQRCLVNPAVSYGTGDMGFVSAGKIPPNFRMLDYLEGRARGNLLTDIDRFQAPLLILHGMKDYRCGFEQAEQLFRAMKDRRPEIPVRLVAFPGENHEVSRSGRLHHQIRHVQEMTDWFRKYLSEAGEDKMGR